MAEHIETAHLRGCWGGFLLLLVMGSVIFTLLRLLGFAFE
jgi:hypothetical protein